MTYLYALRALRRGVVPASESAWLYAIARNVCRWHHRTAARRPVADSSALETLASPEHEDARDFLNELPDALDSLPERQRHALLLREWRGLSADEIAHALQLSAPATHALITRARRSLAHALSAPGRTAAGLGTLVYEARSWIKAAIGGLSAKAAATTVAVVGVGVGGSLAVDQTLADDGAGSRPAGDTPAVVESGGASPSTTKRASLSSVGGVAPGGTARSSADGSASVSRSGSLGAGPMRAFARPRPDRGGVVAPRDDPAPGPTSEPTAGDTDPISAPPTGAPRVPELEVPRADLPPVDVPPVDVPPVDLPGNVVPPVDPPPVDLPPAEPPPIELPPLPPLVP